MFTSAGTRAGRGEGKGFFRKSMDRMFGTSAPRLFAKTTAAGGWDAQTISAFLDAAVGSTRGLMIVRGSALWQALGLGTIGQAVTNNGTDVLWGTVGGGSGGGIVNLGTTTIAGSATTALTISGLDISLYNSFFVPFTLKDAAAGATGVINLFYNSDTTTTDYNEEGGSFNNTTVNFARANDARIANLDASRYVTGFIWIKKDLNGRASAFAMNVRDNSAGVVLQLFAHLWSVNFANVTGITLSSSIASQLAITSTATVYGFN